MDKTFRIGKTDEDGMRNKLFLGKFMGDYFTLGLMTRSCHGGR